MYHDITPEEMQSPCNLSTPTKITDGWGMEECEIAEKAYVVAQKVEMARSFGFREVSPLYKTHREAFVYGLAAYPGSSGESLKKGFYVVCVEGKGREIE